MAIMLLLVAFLPSKLLAQTDGIEKALHFADSVYSTGKHQSALAAYKYASKLDPSNNHAKSRIGEIEQILANEKLLQESYNQSVERINKFVYDKDYISAKDELNSVIKLKPDDSWAKTKLSEVEKILEDQKEQRALWQKKMDEAERSYNKGERKNAVSTLQDAEKILPNQKQTADKLKEINDEIAEIDSRYNAAISSADDFYRSDNLANAKEKYQEAAQIKPKESYPTQKLQQIAAIEENETVLAQQFDIVLGEAEKLFNSAKYEEAVVKYNEALDINPDSQLPKNRLSEISDIKAQNLKLEENYQDAISVGDAAFDNSQWEKAKAEYKKAQTYKPNDSYASQKLSEANKQISLVKDEEKRYNELIKNGDEAIKNLKWTDALVLYEEAVELRPGYKHIVDQLTFIRQELSKLSRNYDNLIRKGDGFLERKSYSDALAKYQEALALKPDEFYPKEKIGEIKSLQRKENEAKKNEGFTSKYNCNKLVYFEEIDNINSAIAREKQLKNWHRAWKENIVNEMNPKWEDLAKNWFDDDVLKNA